jgi:sugar phosphate isomerase/epimerase
MDIAAIGRREAIRAVAGGLSMLAFPERSGPARDAVWEKSFFLMDTWFWESEKELDPLAEAALARRMGYDGTALSWGRKHAERLTALKDEGLQIPGCFVGADIDRGYPAHLSAAVALLKATGGIPWVSLLSSKRGKSDPAGDDAALAILTRCADECKSAGVPGLALYPHHGFWMEKVSDAVRLAKQAGRADVGVQFNQFHWMAADQGRELRKTLEAAAPYLKGVSINGSDVRPSILPLGEGDYDVFPILEVLVELGYKGPVSHQGCGIRGRIPERLAAAKQTWEAMKKRLGR